MLLVSWSKSYENSNKQISVRPRLSHLQCSLAIASSVPFSGQATNANCIQSRKMNTSSNHHRRKRPFNPEYSLSPSPSHPSFKPKSPSCHLAVTFAISTHRLHGTETSSVPHIQAIPFAFKRIPCFKFPKISLHKNLHLNFRNFLIRGSHRSSSRMDSPCIRSPTTPRFQKPPSPSIIPRL